MSRPLRAGLVGCGSVAQRGVLPHLSQPDAQEQLCLAAVADVVAERAVQTAARFQVPAHFTSLEAMLAGTELDLILVTTPIPYHYANALMAVEAGKHVYIQKSMTTTVDEADKLLAARDRMGVKLAAAPGFELFPTTAKMRELVQAGALGRVCVGFTYTLGFGHEFETIRGGEGALAAIDPSWYYRPGAGPLPDVTIYSLQLVTSILGPVRRVTALSNQIAPERQWRGASLTVQVEDNNLVLMEFASGALVTAVGSNCQGSERLPWGSAGLYGTEGTLEITEVDQASGYPLRFALTGANAHTHTATLTDQSYLRGAHLTLEEPHVYADIMDLVDAIYEDRAPRATGEQARHVIELIEKAQIAAQQGQTQTLNTSFQ
jgi:predicted dehydrogenase